MMCGIARLQVNVGMSGHDTSNIIMYILSIVMDHSKFDCFLFLSALW